MNTNKKLCTKCNQFLDLINFCKNSKTKDGYQYWCKGCINDYNKMLYKNNSTYKIAQNKRSESYIRKNNYTAQKKYFKSELGRLSMERYRKTPHGRLISKLASQKHAAKKKNIVHEFTITEAKNKLNQTNGICNICGEYIGIDKLTLDHIIPISKVPHGAVYTIDDIQFICKSCNSRKGNKSDIDYSSYLKPKHLDKITYRQEKYILKRDRLLYEKVVDYIDGKNPIFTERDILILNNL